MTIISTFKISPQLEMIILANLWDRHPFIFIRHPSFHSAISSGCKDGAILFIKFLITLKAPINLSEWPTIITIQRLSRDNPWRQKWIEWSNLGHLRQLVLLKPIWWCCIYFLLQHILVIPTCSIMPYFYSYKLWQLKPLTLPIALLITSHTHLVWNNSLSPSLLWSIISALFRVKPISIMTIVPIPWIWGFCESPRQSFCPDKALQQLVIAAPPNKTSSDHSW